MLAIPRVFQCVRLPLGFPWRGFFALLWKPASSSCPLCRAGGSADVLELRAGDEIMAVDGADVANHYLESVDAVINQAVTVGQLELRIRRSLAHSQ